MPRVDTIDLDGPVRVVDFGGLGQPMVCVHGLGGWAGDWQLIGPGLAQHGYVTALDLPGFGRTPVSGRSASLLAHQRLLDRYLKEVIGRPAILIGNSMGAIVSLLQARAARATVDALVLIGASLPLSPRSLPHPLVVVQFALYGLPRVGERFVRLRRHRLGVRWLVDTTMRFLAAYPERIPREIYTGRYELVEQLAGQPDADRAFLAAARSLLGLLCTPRRYRRIVAGTDLPMLFVHGEHDRLVSVRAARELSRTRPDVRVELLDAGHLPQLERPEEVLAITRSWLAEHRFVQRARVAHAEAVND